MARSFIGNRRYYFDLSNGDDLGVYDLDLEQTVAA
jgi:hypothetical protein